MKTSGNWYLFKLSWRSIHRNSGRSFFIGLTVSTAVIVAIWVVAFFDGLNSQIEAAVVSANTGTFQIQDPKFARSTDSTDPLLFSKELSRRWEKSPVMAASPELVLDGNILTPEGAAGLYLIGVDPLAHARAFGVSKAIHAGSALDATDDGKVLIGNELAVLFKFRVDDKLVLNYQDQTGTLRSEILRVKGIYSYSSRDFERSLLYTNQKTWQKLFLGKDTGETLYNRIVLITPDLTSESGLRGLAGQGGGVLKTWKQLNPEMAVVLDFHEGLVKFFFLIIGLTITLTIVTPVRMLWQERSKELKMMSVIGAPPVAIWKLGGFEVLQTSFLSVVFSLLIVGTVLGVQSVTGIDIRFLNQGNPVERAGIQLPQIIYPEPSFAQVLVTLGFVLLVLGVSYAWSIGRTMKVLQEGT